jgi:hypothetical protein
LCREQNIRNHRNCSHPFSDTDYHVGSDGRLLLNPFLNSELATACGSRPDIYCCNNLSDALTEFAKKAGVSSDKLPTPAEAKQIREEFDYWNANTMDRSIGAIFDASESPAHARESRGAVPVKGSAGSINNEPQPPRRTKLVRVRATKKTRCSGPSSTVSD